MVYVFLANGFEETEALVTVDILRRAGYSVKTVGVGGECITGAHGITVMPDIIDTKLNDSDEFSAVVLPGGMPGTINLKDSKIVKHFIELAVNDGKVVGAICAAPSILGEWGMLNGKVATCYPGFEDKLSGAIVSDECCCIHDNIVTSRGAGTVFEFSFALADLISWYKGRTPYGDFSVSEEVEESIQCVR